MVVRGGGFVAGHPGAGLQEGGQVGSVQAGRQHAAAVEGVGPGGWVKGPEGVRVGIGPENAAQGLAGVSDEAWCAVQRLLYAVEVSNQDWGDGGVQVMPESVEVGCEVIGLCMDVEEGEAPTVTSWTLPGWTSWTVAGRQDRVAMMRSLVACLRVEAVRV